MITQRYLACFHNITNPFTVPGSFAKSMIIHVKFPSFYTFILKFILDIILQNISKAFK